MKMYSYVALLLGLTVGTNAYAEDPIGSKDLYAQINPDQGLPWVKPPPRGGGVSIPNPFDACSVSGVPECREACVSCVGELGGGILKDALEDFVPEPGSAAAACFEAVKGASEQDVGKAICSFVDCASKNGVKVSVPLIAACKGGQFVADVIKCSAYVAACYVNAPKTQPIELAPCSIKPSVARCNPSGPKSDSEIYEECRKIIVGQSRVPVNQLGNCVKRCVVMTKKSPVNCQQIYQTTPDDR